MRIQHNIMAMNAYRNYNNNTSALSKNLEKLSSGYKINRAGDDAAGLAISEKMRAQITGLNAAQKNVKDGISLVKTAEGAMQEIQDMLNRMDYLATQSANGTYDDEVDRANLQKEVDALKTEINRIADSANFNGIKLLDGSMDAGKAAEVVAGTKVEWADQAMNAVDPAGKKVTASLDGKDPSPASKATLTITYGKGADLKTALSTSSFLAAPSGGSGSSGAPLADIFEITNENGEPVDLTAMDATATANEGGTLILTAKNEGAFDSATWEDFLTTLEGKTGITSVEATNGVDVGGAASSGKTKAKYEFTFDLTQLKGGETLEFNGKKILFDKEQKAATSGAWGVEANGQDTDTYYIGIKGVDLSTRTGQETVAKALSAAFLENDMIGTNKFEQSSATNSGTKAAAAVTDEGKLTIKVSATDTNKGVVGNVHVSKFEENENSVISVKVTPGQEDSKGQGQGQAVTAKYNVDLKKLKVGDKISVGGVELEIVEDGDHDSRNGKVAISMAKTFATDEKALHNSLNAAGYEAGNVTVKGNTLTVEKNFADSTTAEAWAKGDGSFKMGKTVTISEEEAAEANKNAGAGKALTLQIGDTADSFNQMKVSVGDMHTKAMGIADIDISNQDGASTAIQTIKDAINYVSGVRGDLGAVQNRLEHTQNNLSVMAENIQDAESTIRDTDVAEEMMSYVKNNILVQSAQAMLAQANQVPQGVLQLLG